MSRTLFVMVEGGGNVPPQLGLASRLRSRGNTVRVLGDPAIESEARTLGLEFSAFRHAPHHNVRSREHDRLRDYAATSPLDALRRMVEGISLAPAAAYARDTMEVIQEFSPSALAVDCLLLGAAIAAEQAAIPTALLVHTVYFLPAPGAPPYGLGLQPTRRALGRAAHALLGRISVAWFDHLGLQRINALRRERGLTPLKHVVSQAQRAQRVLVMTAPGFDFAARASLPHNVRYVGPGLDDPAWAAHASVPGDVEPPDVVVGLGSTFQDQQALTQRVIDALAALPVRALVTLGEVFEPHAFTAAANVQVVRAAPHQQLFPRAKLVVAHGGHGTVMKALAAGVPVLCIPLGRDQADNAARVAHAGAGLRVSRSASTAHIRDALRRLLDDASYRRAAARLASEIAHYQHVDLACRELEQLGMSTGASHAS